MLVEEAVAAFAAVGCCWPRPGTGRACPSPGTAALPFAAAAASPAAEACTPTDGTSLGTGSPRGPRGLPPSATVAGSDVPGPSANQFQDSPIPHLGSRFSDGLQRTLIIPPSPSSPPPPPPHPPRSTSRPRRPENTIQPRPPAPRTRRLRVVRRAQLAADLLLFAGEAGLVVAAWAPADGAGGAGAGGG